MAHDVAKLIWEISKNDKSFEGLSLKELYKKKRRIEQDEMRSNLSKLVSDFIKENPTTKCSMTIHKNSAILGTGGLVYVKIRSLDTNFNPEITTSIFSQKIDDTTWFCVTNNDSKSLIEEGFIPLDFKWSINTFHSCFNISWEHWDETRFPEKNI